MKNITFGYCHDCNKEIQNKEFYMVENKLWFSFASECDLLCINCFEKRLGRPLTKLNFTECVTNRWFFKLNEGRFVG